MRPGAEQKELQIPREFFVEKEGVPFFQQLSQYFRERFSADRLFIDSILNDTKPEPSFYDGLKAQQVMDAAMESAKSGEGVTLVD
jgi:predicted dehydrogenase